jgi:hypothetical protein
MKGIILECGSGTRLYPVTHVDPDLAIPWPIEADSVIASEKDRRGALLRDAEVFP